MSAGEVTRLPLATPPGYCVRDGVPLTAQPVTIAAPFDPVTGSQAPSLPPGERRYCARDASHPSWLRVRDEWRQYP